MSNYEIYIPNAIITVMTYFTRVFFFFFFRKNDLPSYILFIEKYFPSVIMTILIFYTLKEINFSLVTYGMKELGSIVFTALLHLIFKNYLVSIFIGTLFYMGLVQYL